MISTDIKLAKDILDKEGIIGLPTETVYGLAGNAYSEKAIHAIYQLKQRPYYNPLIVHIKSADDLEKVAIDIPDVARLLSEKFWPGPLTLLLKKHPSISSLVSSGKPTVAVRVPNHEMALNLLHQLNFPLVAPSANPFGCISPTKAAHVDAYFQDKLELVLNGGNCISGLESTIVGFANNGIEIYRLGAISKEAIEEVVGAVHIHNQHSNDSPDAPGMLSKHYAPLKPMYITNDILNEIKKHEGKKIALLLYEKYVLNEDIPHQIVLSSTRNLNEAATNLYTSLHELDKLNVDLIIAERLPDYELGRTMNDRLERASKNK